MKKILIFILKIIIFFIILMGMIITLLPAMPSATYSITSDINMYNQKGLIKKFAVPYLFLHTSLCKLFNTQPYKGDLYNYN